MKNSFGESIIYTLFGESHGDAIGIVIDGFAPGIKVDYDDIKKYLSLRRPDGEFSTSRVEADEFEIVSGVYNFKTTGTPICILIKNSNKKSSDYDKLSALARPGHADYSAYCKYHGFEDRRGGGHFSGRITAPIVAAGAIALSMLKAKGIEIGTHISSIGDVNDASFSDYISDISFLSDKNFPVLRKESEEKMKQLILSAKANKDSIGGTVETVVVGMPKGVGEPWFDSLESKISHAMFSIPAVKGISFGEGFNFCTMHGSQANDPFVIDDGEIKTSKNSNGGINGGISNGMPIVFSCAIKPTPSIELKQKTVDYLNLKECDIEVAGRHDPCIVQRAAIVVKCITALTLCDILALRFGTDYFMCGDNL